VLVPRPVSSSSRSSITSSSSRARQQQRSNQLIVQATGACYCYSFCSACSTMHLITTARPPTMVDHCCAGAGGPAPKLNDSGNGKQSTILDSDLSFIGKLAVLSFVGKNRITSCVATAAAAMAAQSAVLHRHSPVTMQHNSMLLDGKDHTCSAKANGTTSHGHRARQVVPAQRLRGFSFPLDPCCCSLTSHWRWMPAHVYLLMLQVVL
jgi:hypothetical protein